MFVTIQLKEQVSIHPRKLGSLELHNLVTDELNHKYSNRVIHKLGLCIMVYNINQLDDSFIHHTEGHCHVFATFELIMFRPFIDEVIEGKIVGSSPKGLQISTGFFKDIHVPVELMRPGTDFDSNENVFFWLPPAEDEEENQDEQNRLYLDIGQSIRVQVVNEVYHNHDPHTRPDQSGQTNGATEDAQTEPPYSLICSILEDGLGPVDWWVQA